MSKIDQKLIENLSNFSKALENVVEILKTQSKQGKPDATLDMGSKIDGQQLKRIVQNLDKLNKKTDKIEKTNQEILKQVKAIRESKETGNFQTIENDNNKEKIKDGVKTVILIAAGVLAVGTAFKLIGKVDVPSVIALGLGMIATAYAFKTIIQIKEIQDYKKVLLTASVLPLMALALTISSKILAQSSVITIPQALSIGFTGIGLGLAMIGISKMVKSLDMKDIGKILLLPIVIPIIAAGMVTASWLFSLTKPIGIIQMVSILFTSLTITIAAIGISFMLKALKNSTAGQLLAATTAIPLIAGGIVAASWILSGTKFIKNPLDLLLTVGTISLSLAMFSIPMLILGKMNYKQLFQGSLGILLVAGTIPLVSYLISKGNYTGNRPDWKWSLEVGLSLGIFGAATYLLGKVDTEKILQGSINTMVVASTISVVSGILSFGNYTGNRPDWKWSLEVGLSLGIFGVATYLLGKLTTVQLLMGSLNTLIVSSCVVAASWILSLGKYNEAYPSLPWSIGVGSALVAFSIPIVALGLIGMSGIGAVGILLGAGLVTIVAGAIVATSLILSGGKYDNSPSLPWSLGVGASLLGFGTSMVALGLIPFARTIIKRGSNAIEIVAESIVKTSKILAGGNWSGGPTVAWSMGVGLALSTFVSALSGMKNAGKSGIEKIFGGGKGTSTKEFNDFITSVSSSMVLARDLLNDGKEWTGGPTKDWSEGVGNSVVAFANAINLLSSDSAQDFIKGKGGLELAIMSIATSIKGAAVILSDPKVKYGVYPTKEWSEGVGSSINVFAGFIDKLSGRELNKFEDWSTNIAKGIVAAAKEFNKVKNWTGPDKVWIDNLTTLSNLNIKSGNISSIDKMSKAIVGLSDNLNKINVNGIDKLSKITSNLSVLGVIDDDKLNKVLDIVDKQKDTLKIALDDNGLRNNLNDLKKNATTIKKVDNNQTNLKKEENPNESLEKKLDTLIDKMSILIDLQMKRNIEENFDKK